MTVYRTLLPALCAALLAACGGGGGGTSSTSSTATQQAAASIVVSNEPGAPARVGVTATDGLNWFNFRRQQMGLPALTRNSVIDLAAQGHSDYQRINNTIVHDQTAGKNGYTGVTLLERLRQAGYTFAPRADYAYGEVISATTDPSGAYMAEELITAIYHRFVIFEPMFKEAGAGSATVAGGYTYFTTNFAASNGYGPGIARSTVAVYPYENQINVPRNFFSDYELPDPVPGANEVGYPVSVHANINATVTVQSFTLAPRGGSPVSVRLLTSATDSETPVSAAAIVPLSVLTAGTVYTATFAGTVNGVQANRTWNFTVR
ncbi:MAG TPA: CAP domain-containing protein [Burkholderiaceae bacterium]